MAANTKKKNMKLSCTPIKHWRFALFIVGFGGNSLTVRYANRLCHFQLAPTIFHPSLLLSACIHYYFFTTFEPDFCLLFKPQVLLSLNYALLPNEDQHEKCDFQIEISVNYFFKRPILTDWSHVFHPAREKKDILEVQES